MKPIQRYFLIGGILAVSVAVDQVTKQIARSYLGSNSAPILYLGDLFRFHYAENTGAFLSLGSGLSDGMRFWLLTGVNSVVLLAVAVFLVVKPKMDGMMTIALSLILSGGIGNLIDRMFNDGRVIDFLNLGLPWVSIGGWEPRTGIFNVADVAIVVGLVLVFSMEFFKAYREQEAAKSAGNPKSSEVREK